MRSMQWLLSKQSVLRCQTIRIQYFSIIGLILYAELRLRALIHSLKIERETDDRECVTARMFEYAMLSVN
jgi:hypothetical protein